MVRKMWLAAAFAYDPPFAARMAPRQNVRRAGKTDTLSLLCGPARTRSRLCWRNPINHFAIAGLPFSGFRCIEDAAADPQPLALARGL